MLNEHTLSLFIGRSGTKFMTITLSFTKCRRPLKGAIQNIVGSISYVLKTLTMSYLLAVVDDSFADFLGFFFVY